MTYFVCKGLTRNPEIGNTPIWVLPNIWRLGRSRDTKFGRNVSNKMLLRVTVFTISELLRENQQGSKLSRNQVRVKLSIELNPNKVLDTILPTSMAPINSTFIGKIQNYLYHGSPKLQNAINETQSMSVFIIQKEHNRTWTMKSLWEKESLWRLMTHYVPLTVYSQVSNKRPPKIFKSRQ